MSDNEIALSYDDILDINVQSPKSNSVKTSPVPELEKNTVKVTEQPEKKSNKVAPAAAMAENRPIAGPVLPADLLNDMNRPLTGVSRVSVESDIDLVVAPGTARSSITTPKSQLAGAAGTSSRTSSRGNRTQSAGRPPPQKPYLHKTAAATGASFNTTSQHPVETEYIHFTQQLMASSDHPEMLAKRSSSPSGSAAIQSISNHNLPDPATGTSESPRSKIDSPSTSSPHVMPSSPLVISPRGDNNPRPVTPPSSPKLDEEQDEHDQQEQEEQVHYAFNIPTADIVESEIDPSELRPVLEEEEMACRKDGQEAGKDVEKKDIEEQA